MKLVAKPRSSVPYQLAYMLRMLNVDEHVKAEIMGIGKQAAGSETRLNASDLAQLRDLARVSQRIETGSRLAATLTSGEDLKAWASIVGKIQADTSLKRALMRDLLLSKASRSGKPTKPEPEGGDWTGVL